MKSAAKAGRGRAGKAAPGKSKVAEKAVKKTAKKVVRKAAKPAKKPAAQVGPPEAKASAELRIEQFVHAYFACNLVGRTAAIAVGYSPDSARTIASQLLAREDVQAMIRERQAAVLQEFDEQAKWFRDRLMGMAGADAREVSELHLVACRYCWGDNHRYHRRSHERENAYLDWLKDEADKAKLDPAPPPVPFDELGGVGYTTNRDPHPACPACDGRGERLPVFKDTRDLSPEGRMIFAGVKVTQHGLEVKTHDQRAALIDLGKHLGMFSNKVELTGKDGGPVKHEHDITQMFAELEGSETGIGPSSPLPGG